MYIVSFLFCRVLVFDFNKKLWYVSSPMMSARAIIPFGLLAKTVEKHTEIIEGNSGKAPSRGLYGLAS